MLQQILTAEQEALLAEERRLLEDLGDLLERLGAHDERAAVIEALETLGTLFTVAVIAPAGGAVDALADGVLGEAVLGASDGRGDADSARPDRSVAVAVRTVRRSRRPGADPAGQGAPAVEDPSREIIASDLPVLDRLTLSTWAGEPPVPDALGRPDLMLVLTSASQPLTGTERDLLRAADDRSTRTMIVVDEMEMLRLSEDVDRMEEAVEVSSRRILGHAVPVHGISTVRVTELPPPAASLIPALSRQVEMTLRSPQILGPKLRRPAEAGKDLAARHRAVLDERLAALGPDREHLDAIDGVLDSLQQTAEQALRVAVDEAGRILASYATEAGSFVRRWTRPFRLAGRRGLGRRFADGPGRAAQERLEATAATLEETLRGAGERGRTDILERLGGAPTPRLEAHPADPSAAVRPDELSDGGERPVDDLLRDLDAEPTGRTLVGPLHRASLASVCLLVVGILFAAVPVLWSLGWGGGAAAEEGLSLVPVVLGGGLGGAAILAAVSLLKLSRRRLVEDLAGRVESRRATAAAALSALAERWTRRAAERVRGPVTDYAAAVADEVGRLEAAREECGRLETGLDELLRRLP